MNKLNISVSIDDGHPLDIKAAEILLKKNIYTTFYIPIKNSTGRPTLNRKQIKWLSQQPNFEIGGHTYNHIDLTKVSLKKAEEEMRTGKEALEDIIGKNVITFAWPWGKYNNQLINILKKIGFLDCRSAVIFNINPNNKKNYLWHPNLHIYPHPTLASIKHCFKRMDMNSLYRRIYSLNKKQLDFVDYFKINHESVHFWFHSWEIEKLNLWNFINGL